LEAAQSGDYATALQEWRPLAEQGGADAQTMLGGGCTNWPRRSTRLRRDGKVVRAWHLDNDGCLITHLSFIS